jgi:hypothetical protein
MNIRAWTTRVTLVALLGFGASPAMAADPLATTLRKVVDDNAAAFSREDLAAAMSSVATKSPDYAPTKAELATQFAAHNAKAEVVDFKYIGHDDEFAVARVKTKIVAAPKSPDFADNTVDSIVLFHQDNGVWKLWSEDILGVEVLP